MLRSLLLRLLVPMLLLALAGCAAAPGHKATPTIQAAPAASATGIADLVKLPQDLTAYLDQADADAPLITPQEQEAQAAPRRPEAKEESAQRAAVRPTNHEKIAIAAIVPSEKVSR